MESSLVSCACAVSMPMLQINMLMLARKYMVDSFFSGALFRLTL
jgi:hypothetical protein